MFDPCRQHGTRGQALPLVAFGLVALFGLASLAVDVGYWRYEQRMQQGAADSGAMAGANEIPYVSGTPSPNPIVIIAKRDAATNGYTDGANNVTVTVNSPPQSGAYAGSSNAVEVIVAKSQPTFFSKIFGRLSQTVSARAVASRGTPTRNCIFGLDPWSAAINFNNSTVYIPQCGIISNGSYLANGSTVTSSSIGYVGQNQNIWGNIYPEASPKLAVPVADPCPTLAGCAYLKANPPTSGPCVVSPGPSGFNYTDNSPGLTFSPGKYCSQININAGNNPGPVTFLPGTYDFENGMNVNSGIPEMDGNGVTFYLNGGNFNINNNPKMNLVAPSSGNDAGMLLFGSSNFTSDFHINSGPSGPNGSYAGGIYLPNSRIIVDGTLSTWLLVVGKGVVLNSDSTVNDASSAFPGLTRPAALVE